MMETIMIINPKKDRHMFSEEEITKIVECLCISKVFEPAYKASSNGLVQNTMSDIPLGYFWEREEGPFDPDKSPPVRFSIKFKENEYVIGIDYHKFNIENLIDRTYAWERDLSAGKTIREAIKRAEPNAIQILNAYKAVDKLK